MRYRHSFSRALSRHANNGAWLAQSLGFVLLPPLPSLFLQVDSKSEVKEGKTYLDGLIRSFIVVRCRWAITCHATIRGYEEAAR